VFSIENFKSKNLSKLLIIKKDIEYQKYLIDKYAYPDNILREKGKIIYLLEDKYYDIETKYTNMCSYSANSENLFRREIDHYSSESDIIFKSCEKKFKFLSWVLYVTAIVYSIHKEDISILHKIKNLFLLYIPESFLYFLYIANSLISFCLLFYFFTILMKFFNFNYFVFLYKTFRKILSKIYICPVLLSPQTIDRFLLVLINFHWIFYAIFSYILIDFYFILEK